MSQSWTHKRVATPTKLTHRVRQRLDELDTSTFPEDSPYKKLGAYWWITRMNRMDVAFAGLKPIEKEPKAAFMCRAGVLPSARGLRIHRELIKLRIRAAWRMGLETIITYTIPSNSASNNSLISSGFQTYSPDSLWAGPESIYWVLNMDV